MSYGRELCHTGTAKNIGGKLEEGFACVTGDTKTQAAGVAKQVSGAAQDMYGQARTLLPTRRVPRATLLLHLRKCCEIPSRNQPYTSAFVALGIGWLLGRMHRPF